MTMVVVPHETSGWAARVARHTGGRAHLRQTALISLVLSVMAGVVCGLLAPGSHEVATDIGDLPVWPQDEVRVAAEVWFTIALGVVAVVTTVLWWRPFRRGSTAAADGGQAESADKVERAPAHSVEPANHVEGKDSVEAADSVGAADSVEAADPVEAARGPIGLGIATAAALVQTGVAMLAWHAAVGLRGFAEPGEAGSDRIAAPILSSATALWVAALCAVVTYLVLAILAPTSALTSRSAEADKGTAEAEPSEESAVDRK